MGTARELEGEIKKENVAVVVRGGSGNQPPPRTPPSPQPHLRPQPRPHATRTDSCSGAFACEGSTAAVVMLLAELTMVGHADARKTTATTASRSRVGTHVRSPQCS